MKFSEVIGQEAIKRRLVYSVERDHISHAQLFVGCEGVGSLAMAMAYAQYIHCTDRQGREDACGKCPACLKHAKMSHPDMHYVFPMVSSSSPKIEVCDDVIHDFRRAVSKHEGYMTFGDWMNELDAGNKQALIYAAEGDEILRKMSYKTHEAEYKILLIWLPEKMNETCANRLLKIIEEPYPKTLFLLVSEEPERIIQTILSRTQRLMIPLLKEEEVSQALIERKGVDPEAAHRFARIGMGNYVDALSAMDNDEATKEFFDLFVLIMRKAYVILKLAKKEEPMMKFNALKEMLDAVEEMCAWSRERQRQYLEYAQGFLRENFIANLRNQDLNYMNPDEEQFSSRFAPFIHERNIELFMNEFALAQRQIEQNCAPKYVFSDLALKTILFLK